MGISPIADMDVHQTTVTAALTAKSSAVTQKNARSVARLEDMRREISRPASWATITTTSRACGKSQKSFVLTLEHKFVSGHDLGRAERTSVRVCDVETSHFFSAEGWRAAPALAAERLKG